MAFLDNLVEKGIVKSSEINAILRETKDNDGDIDKSLEERGIDPGEIAALRSAYYNIPSRNAEGLEVSFQVLKNVPEESAQYYKFVPLAMEDGVLAIGIVNPDNIGARDAIQFIASKLNIPFKLYLISYTDFTSLISQYKGLSGEVSGALSELETELVQQPDETTTGGIMEEVVTDLSKTQIIEDAPVTKIVAVILRHAIEGGASDVHIEPLGTKVRVRFRVDGTMYTSIMLPAKVHNAVVARIKVLSNLKLDEKRKPQDGRFSTNIAGRKVDFRVSTFPTYYGEKVVMRILDTSQKVMTLESLGLLPEGAELIRKAIKRPYGLILLTGPTGSGKTTTLYSMISELDRDTRNVLSLEDPIEYNIPGMSQSQVHPEIDYTFATGLRSILRQDPDIIMVGEIRDKETAQLAIQAALTGHLVLSTLHTNNAAGVIPRLLDMGVDPFLIAPTLILAIAQRLVKVTCPGSEKAVPIEGSIKAIIENEVKDLPEKFKGQFLSAKEVYEALPTDLCPTGTRGRVAVFEILEINKAIEEVILKTPVEEEIFKTARKNGMLTMKEDAILKAIKGQIPFEQINEL